jgi:pimeloyl-ACP methyl ester carboxylesterase
LQSQTQSTPHLRGQNAFVTRVAPGAIRGRLYGHGTTPEGTRHLPAGDGENDGASLAAVTQDLLPLIKCPTLVMQSRDDHVVHPSNGPRIVGLVGAKRVELLWLEDSYHVATIDFDKDLIARRTIAFIRSIAGQ